MKPNHALAPIALMLSFSVFAVATLLALTSMPTVAVAQDKSSAADLKVIRDCARQKLDQVDGGEGCIFIIAQPCMKTPAGQSTFGEADCYRREAAAWDALLNEAYRRLRGELDNAQNRKLRNMQRAWISSRDQTCAFYDTLIQGSMAVSAASACVNRETARRTMLIMSFQMLAPRR